MDDEAVESLDSLAGTHHFQTSPDIFSGPHGPQVGQGSAIEEQWSHGL